MIRINEIFCENLISDKIDLLKKEIQELKEELKMEREVVDEINNYETSNMVCSDYDELKQLARETIAKRKIEL